MCGIVYLKRADGRAASRQLLKRYTKQRDRGEDGFGFIALGEDNKLMRFERYQNEDETRAALKEEQSAHILFHHRFPTSTINIPEAAHPIRVRNDELAYDYFVVHNGVIAAPDKIKAEHEKLGYKYTTEISTHYKSKKGMIYNGGSSYNDSEAFAIEIARTIEGKQDAVKTTGSIAYIVLQVSKKSKKARTLYYGTNGGNALTVDRSNGLCIASEGGKRITPGICYTIDLKTGEESTIGVPIPMYALPTLGYGYQRIRTLKEPEEEDYIPAPYSSYLPSDNSQLDELEATLAEIDGDLAIAMQAEEQTEIENLQFERQAVLEDIADIVANKTIGF